MKTNGKARDRALWHTHMLRPSSSSHGSRLSMMMMMMMIRFIRKQLKCTVMLVVVLMKTFVSAFM